MARRFIISGGGTGGHIFPAIAIARAIQRHEPEAEILFVGALGKMEMEKVPLAGFRIIGLDISGFQRGSWRKNIRLPFQVFSSLWKAVKIVRDFKPDAAVGVGGYASGPLLFAAALCGIPTLIQEQNAVPGLTNRILAGRAGVICAAYDNILKVYPGKKVVLCGNPVREGIEGKGVSRDEACAKLGLDSSRPVVLITGGSLGAKTFNEAVRKNIELIRESSVQWIWQTGKSYFNHYSFLSDEIPHLHCRMFIDDMDVAYSAADVVVSRGGALSIAELQILGKPAILVPSPNVTDDQQTANVRALVVRNAAVMISEIDAEKLLITEAMLLAQDTARCRQLSEDIQSMALPGAADIIATELFKLIS